MLKPKNISIKRVTQTDPIVLDNKINRNSRKSLKVPKRQLNHSNNHSPINIMKLDTNLDDSQQSDHGDFIKCINGYLNQLDENKGQSRSRNTTDVNEIQKLRRKIHKQKQINRTMQKNIVQFQRILLQRTEKLDKLEQCMRRIQAKEKGKENQRNLVNISRHGKSRHKLIRKTGVQEISSQLQHSPSENTSGQILEEHYSKYKQRRKTEIPTQIERMISRTLAVRPQKYSRQKN